MSTPDQKDASIEAILDDLYANELNVSISWNHRRGFHAVLVDPVLADNWFPTSGEAVQWLKDQAIGHFPRAEFGPSPAPRDPSPESILDDLCASHKPSDFDRSLRTRKKQGTEKYYGKSWGILGVVAEDTCD